LLLRHGCKYGLEFVFTVGAENMHINSERMSGLLRRALFNVSVRIVRIHEISDGDRPGHNLVQQLQPLSDRGWTK
jgi:hypothetical protein